jgi:hypothetical protein
MATEKWIGGSGQGLTYGDAFATANLNSLGSGNAIAGTTIDNSTALDQFADISFNLGSAAFVAPNYIAVYLYPLNKDASTFGDGAVGTASPGSAVTPASTYYVGTIVIVAATQVQEGTLRGIVLPPGQFKFVLWNQGGVAWNASGNTCQYRTYNRAVN